MKNANKILQALYHGQIHEWEAPIERTAEELELLHEAEKEYELFKSTLTPEEFGRLEALINLYTKIYTLDFERVYVRGFKLGAAIICAALSDEGGS